MNVQRVSCGNNRPRVSEAKFGAKFINYNCGGRVQVEKGSSVRWSLALEEIVGRRVPGTVCVKIGIAKCRSILLVGARVATRTLVPE